ncbi:MAG TPA: hypothetical protein VFF70_13670 [Anaerolineae bacterium]|nr:hypothetical protein [Anaerolineae bacterium]
MQIFHWQLEAPAVCHRDVVIGQANRIEMKYNSTKDLKKIETLRYLYLKRLYELSDGSALQYVAFASVSRSLGWDDETTVKVTAYLKGESLVEFPASGKVYITHKGIKWIEKALSRFDRSTRHSKQAGFVTFMAEGDISIGGDVVGRDKKTKSSKRSRGRDQK